MRVIIALTAKETQTTHIHWEKTFETKQCCLTKYKIETTFHCSK